MGLPKFNLPEKQRKVAKTVLGGIIVVLLGAFGLEATNSDWDLGKLLSGEGVQESKVARDEQGNVVWRDKEGNVVTDKSKGKPTNDYNCDDFSTQPEAQKFFVNAGGTSKDTNRLDGDNNGEACQALPAGKK